MEVQRRDLARGLAGVAGDERLTFAELDRISDSLAYALVSRGIAKGDRIAIAMRNCPAWIVSYMATLKAGAIATLLNGWWQPHEMKHALDQAIASVRRISTELRPPILDDLGFGEAVVWQAREIAKRSGLELDMDMAAAERVQDASLATALFRITQESMTNIVRHAQASHVRIRLNVVQDQLVLTVRDDGVGYVGARKGGVGLASMQERAMAMGGSFHVGRHGDGPGTEITVSLALSLPVFQKESS